MPRGQVAEIQRRRMLSAAVDAVEDVGYARMTVAQVIGRARVSRKTFYDVFADREDCFLAAFDQALEQGRGRVKEAYESETNWREAIRAALATLLASMDEEPGLTKLCVVEAQAGGPKVLERRAQAFTQMAQAIDAGRETSGAAGIPPEVTAEGLVGALYAVIHARVLQQDEGQLLNLLGPLMSMIVLPYLGARAAARELTLAPPPIRRQANEQAPMLATDPLEGLNMRLTYRTVRVLMVISDSPRANNREVAVQSGIADQGQISKLLNRLSRLELIENLGDGRQRGAANAWQLTARGAAVERATRPR
jgi:AcrR family transcriptional regulator